MYLGGVKVGSN